MTKRIKLLTLQEDASAVRLYVSGKSTTEIGRLFGVARSVIRTGLIKSGVILRQSHQVRTKYHVDDSYFSEIDSHEKAYVLGLLMSDGNIRSGNSNRIALVLHKKDRHILESVSRQMKYSGKIIDESKRSVSRLTVTSEQMKLDLINLGCVPRKTYCMSYPNISNEFTNSFILGYFDGDGSISDRGTFSILGVENFVEEIKKHIVENVDIDHDTLKINRRTETKCLFELRIDKQYVTEKVLSWLYRNSELRLHRKFNRYIDLLANEESCKHKERIDNFRKDPSSLVAKIKSGMTINAIANSEKLAFQTVKSILAPHLTSQ